MIKTELSRVPWRVRPLYAAALCLAATAVSAQTAGPRALDARVVGMATEPPVRFEENRGQADPRVRYISRARDYTVALTADEALLLVRKPTTSPRSQLQSSDLALLRMRLEGASPTPRITANDRLPGKVYFAAAGASGALTPIDTFARVEYSEIYPGIDLIYYGDDHQLEFDFVVAPFADPDRIALSLDGAEGLALTETGDVAMHVGGAPVRLKKPLVYQERDGRRTEIAGAYVLPTDETHTVRLRLGNYDRSRPLVIDPAWMTTFGSTSDDQLSGLAVDSAGHPRALGTTFDPATFPFTHLESGVFPPPSCFLTKLDGATGLTTYTILFQNTLSCGTLALSPSNVAYFTGYVHPSGSRTTVTVVDDSSDAPVIRRFGVANYDSTAVGDGVDALTVNNLGHVFLLGPCRMVGPGNPPLQLSGYNDTPDAADERFGVGCAPPGPGLIERTQPILTVVDSNGAFLYGSFLSPGEHVSEYGLAADDTGRAYIVGAFSETISPTPDAYRSECLATSRSIPLCGYLMVLDTAAVGPSSLVYASYLWNTEDAVTVVVRLGPAGEVYIASEGRVFEDFPGQGPSEGIQLARFNRDAGGAPHQFDFATVFDPSRDVAALAGHFVWDTLVDLRLYPSGAPAIATIAYTDSLPPLGIVTSFDRAGARVGEVWTQTLGTRNPVSFGIATGAGNLFLAGQVDRIGASDTDVFVEQIDVVDPGANRPPTVRILESMSTNGGPLTIYADSPTAGALFQLNALADDPDGDALTYSWSGPFTNNPVTTYTVIFAGLALGTQQTVTVTVDDGHGNVASVSQVFHVVGTPFAGTTATPVDSSINSLVINYAPLTMTATAISGDGGNAYLRTRLDQYPPVPPDLQAGSPPIYFDVSADAVLVGPFTFCIDTRGMSFANPAGIRLYHDQHSSPLGAWVDITSPGYPRGQQVCGQSNSLGTFAIFYPQVPPTAVQTIAGNGVREGSNDGPGGNPIDDYQDGPATATPLNYLSGGAFDRANNVLFISDFGYILRVNLNDNTIARVAGNGISNLGSIDGPGGDPRDDLVEGGDAFNTFVGQPAELAVSPTGDVVFFDRGTCNLRRLDVAQSRLFAVAGNGTCGISGDGLPAAVASLSFGPMAFDAAGNLFIGDGYAARVRRIDAVTNLIDTVVPALSIGVPLGLAFDAQGHLLIAGSMHLLRVSPGTIDGLVDGDADEVITVLGGCNTNCIAPFNGDGLAISHPQVYLSGMGHLTVAHDGSVLLSDSFRVRRIVPGADGIVTGAADEIISTVAGYFDWQTSIQIPNFNGDTFSTQSLFSRALFPFDDGQGGIIVVDTNNFRVRRFGLPPQPVDPNGADLAIAVTAAPDPVNTNASLRYDVAVTNNGPADATGVTMTYVIPAGAVFTSAAATASVVCSAPAPGSAGTVTCNFGTIVSGSSSTAAITVTPQTAGTLSSTFTVSGVEADSNGGNNSSTSSTTVVVGPAVIDVTEVVTVADAVALLPSAMIGVTESITVTDTPEIVGDTTPPIAIFDSPLLVILAGQPLMLSGALSTDVGGTTARYRWQIPDAGVDVETIAPSYQVNPEVLSALAPGSHVARLIVTDSSGNASAPASMSFSILASQSTTPGNGAPPTALILPITSGLGDYMNPHVNNDLLTYDDIGAGTIRYFDFATGVNTPVPNASGDTDTLSDVNDGRITFSRQNSTGRSVQMFVPATGTTQVVSVPGTGQPFENVIGNNTVAFVDLLNNAQSQIVTVSLATAVREVLAGTTLYNVSPNVSPDGNTVVWLGCSQSVSNCDVFKASGGPGAWAISPVTPATFEEAEPDTDGTHIVYSSDRPTSTGGADIYFQPIGGGVETGLSINGIQRNSNISRGVIAFESQDAANLATDLYVYEIATNLLHRVTSTPNVNELLSDISVLDNGDIRLVWAADDAVVAGDHNIYATTFSLLRQPTLTVTPAAGVAGESITLSATLTLNGGPIDDALLEFHVTGDPAMGLDRTDANGVATVSGVFSVNPGTYPNGIVVNFAGDPARRLAAANATGALTISTASTGVVLTAAPNPVVVGDAVEWTAVVTSAFGLPDGAIVFRPGDSAQVIGTAAVTNGVATFAQSGLPLGEHTICGEYTGSTIHEGSLGCATVTVVKAATQLELSSSRNPSITTGPPVFIATIQTASSAQPTGKVEFFADGTLLCRSTLYSLGGVRTQASCGGASLPVGAHSITATYTGDANFETSSAASITQTVQLGGYFALDLGFDGEAVALSPNGWVTGNSELKAALTTANTVTAYAHDGTTLGIPRQVPSLGGTKTMAVGVDDTGRVGGSSTTATGATHVFLFDGVATNDHHNPTFGGQNSRAMAMNSSGAIVGIADTATAVRAFVDLRAGAFDLGTIAGGTSSAAFAISEPVFGPSGLGHIVGVSTVPGGSGHAALFGGATAIDLGTLGGPASGASAVNRAGESAGFSDVASGGRHAFIHRDGAMVDIGATLGSSLSVATAINDAGQVVGTYQDTSTGTPVSRAFLYSLDTTTDLTLGSFATLNNAGVVVHNMPNGFAVRTGGGVLLPGAGSGLPTHQPPLRSATAINDEGRIAGFIIGPSGRPRATVWIPVGLASLTVDAAAAPSGATVALSATLTSQGVAVANKTIQFTIESGGSATAVTDGFGRATVTATVPLLTPGVYPEGIRALFTGDETLGGAVATAALTVEAASADLRIAAGASPTTVDAGATVRYTVTLTNSGPSPASDVSINGSGPAGLIFGTINSPGGPCIRSIFGNTFDCVVSAPIPAGGKYVLTIDARPTVAGTVSATFAVTGSSADPAPANNQASVAVTVNPATDLALAVVPSRTLITVGESLTYAVSVTNTGTAAATGAFFTILPASGFVIDGTTLPAPGCTIAAFSGLWSCALGTIAPGAMVQFSVIGRVTGALPGTNFFAVGSALPDPNPANNTAALTFDARPTVTIKQAAGQSDPTTATPINFTVTFSESITGFSNADISFSGSSVGGTLAATVTGSGATYNVAVTGMTGVGTVFVSIPAGAAVDSGGNPSAASTSSDSSVLFGVATLVAIVSPSNGGNATVTVLKFGNSIQGMLSYARAATQLTATRFTSLIIDGQTATLEGFGTNNRFFVVKVRDGGSGQADTFRLWIEGVEQTATSGAIATGSVLIQPWAPDTRLKGWVDLHTHPMSNLAFGGKLFHGAPSVGSIMPAMQMPGDPECRPFDQRATSIAEALSQDGPTRGDGLQSKCGDFTRNLLIKTIESFNGAVVAPAGSDGYPAFTHWPKWSDITHQKMWVDWIRRSWEGGQRVMVALSHNNRTLADLLGAGGPISGVRNDRASSDLQIEEIKQLVAAHSDFMAVATTPGDLHDIVRGGRLAIVLGVEIDKIGDFSTTAAPTEAAIDAEIARLHAQGVRYILPVHFVDNAFGDAALHQPLYNILNFRENGSFFTVGCALFSDEIGFTSAGFPPILAPFLLPGMPAPVVPSCAFGHVNGRNASGLTPRGEFAIRAMMRRGIIIDVDHMSNRAANRTLAIADAVPGGGYPVTSGHSGIRERTSPQFNAENMRSTTQLARIACLGGMFGLGTDAAGAHRWAQQYERGYNVMRRAFAPNGLCPSTLPLGAGFVALGTDANSLVKTPVPPMLDPAGPPRFADIYNQGNPLNAGVPPLTKSTTGLKTWDYNSDGVAHYGMFVDFLRDVRMFNPTGTMPGRQMVDDQMMYGAEYFYRMWLKVEAQRTNVP